MEEERVEEMPLDQETTTASAPESGETIEEETTVTRTPQGREIIRERLRGYNPEGEYEEDEAFYGGVSSALDDRDRLMESNRQLAEVFQRSPQTASFFIDMMDGKGLYESLARNFGDDLKLAIEGGDEVAGEYDRGLEEWRQKRDARAKEEEELRANLETFSSEFDAWLSENGYSEEERASLNEEMQRIAEAMSRGNHMDFARAIDRARRYDADIESARAEGEIRGRNARIAEERSMPTRRGDGLPMTPNSTRADERIAVQDNNGWSW